MVKGELGSKGIDIGRWKRRMGRDCNDQRRDLLQRVWSRFGKEKKAGIVGSLQGRI